MTNNAKAVLFTVLGVGAASVLIGAFMIAIIGISLIAAAGSDEESGVNKRPAINDERRRKAQSDKRERIESPAGEPLPAEIVGIWQHRAGGGETDFTGKTRYGSTRRQTYKIASDGAVEYTFERETLTIMQCEIKERRAANGKASTDKETLVINFGAGDHAESNSCEGGATEEKQLPAETVQLNYRLKTEDDATRLCFDEQDGEACYDRQD